MRNLYALICIFTITSCVGSNQQYRGYPSITLNKKDQTTTLVVQHFSNLCLTQSQNTETLIKTAKSENWQATSAKPLKQKSLQKLERKTLRIPGGGSPVEETQLILSKSFIDETLVLVISERFDRKRLTATTCSFYSKQEAFLKNCASLGELLNRAPDKNTQYKESKAHFISWNASIAGKRARIKCQHTPQSPTLPYDGTQLILSIDHVTSLKSVPARKSSQQRFDVSGR